MLCATHGRVARQPCVAFDSLVRCGVWQDCEAIVALVLGVVSLVAGVEMGDPVLFGLWIFGLLLHASAPPSIPIGFSFGFVYI